MQLSPSIFKAYDIRGVVPATLTDEVAYALGRAFGQVALGEGERTVAVGRDGRLSGPGLSAALMMGCATAPSDPRLQLSPDGRLHCLQLRALRIRDRTEGPRIGDHADRGAVQAHGEIPGARIRGRSLVARPVDHLPAPGAGRRSRQANGLHTVDKPAIPDALDRVGRVVTHRRGLSSSTPART